MNIKTVIILCLTINYIEECVAIEPISIGIGLGSGIGFAGMYAGYEYLKSKFFETCNDIWISPSLTGLETSLEKHLHGQHIVRDVVMKAIRTHFRKKTFNKPLVLSFHGWTGGGKNYVSKLIADNLYAVGLKSRFVHLFISTVHFPHQDKAAEYRDNLQHWLKGNVSECPLSLFIFDEIDKMPIGVLDGIKPYVDYYDTIDGVDFKRSIFIFLSNTGGADITERMLKFWHEGKLREELTYFDFEDMIRTGAFNEKGGLFHTSVIDKNLIDYYIPFLPLEREHVKLCIQDELRERGVSDSQTTKLIEEVANEMQYFPKEIGLYSTTGCKRVAQKVDYFLN